MKSLCTNAVSMSRSGIREIMDLARGIPGVIHLEIGEPMFPTPQHIKDAAHRAALEGFTKYAPNAGMASLRELIVKKLKTVNGLDYTPDNVVVTIGGVGGIATSVLALVDPGDEVLIPDPGWPNYEMIVLSAKATLKRYSLRPESGFLPDLDEIGKSVTPRTKALIINTPANPTGMVFPEETVRKIVQFATEHDLYLISDEVYDQLIFEGTHVSPALFDTEGRVICGHSFSKTYSMTGWRVGYVAAPEKIARVIAKLQEPFISSVPSMCQKAAEAALSGPQDCVGEMRETYRRHRDIAVSLLRGFGLKFSEPRGAFYTLVDITRTGMSSDVFARSLLQQEAVAVAPGSTFGPEGEAYIRLSLASAEADIVGGISRIGRFIQGVVGSQQREVG